MKTKRLAVNGLLAAVYAALTVCLSPVSYNVLQFRVSELLLFLILFDRRLWPGLVLGCAIANCFSPARLFDVPAGALATFLTVYIVPKLLPEDPVRPLIRNFIFAISGGLINGVIVGAELGLLFHIPPVHSMFFVFIGESAVLISGAMLFALPGLRRMIKKIEW